MLGRERCEKLKELIFLEDYDYASWDKLAYNDNERDIIHSIRNGLLYISHHRSLRPFIKKMLLEAVNQLKEEQNCDLAEIIERIIDSVSP